MNIILSCSHAKHGQVDDAQTKPIGRRSQVRDRRGQFPIGAAQSGAPLQSQLATATALAAWSWTAGKRNLDRRRWHRDPGKHRDHHAPHARGYPVRSSPRAAIPAKAPSPVVGTGPKRKRIRRNRTRCPPTPRRPEHPLVEFRSNSELKRYLGPAGEGRSWHHIVEQRLADNGRFPTEWIHSTDNVINVPDILHQCINAEMSKIKPDSGGLTVRQWLEPQSFEFQYDYGLELIEECVEKVSP